MKCPCEETVKTILPAIRAELAKKLEKEYNMKQTEISKLLGITQGAVSHYVTSFRGKERELLSQYSGIEADINELISEIVDEKDANNNFCKYCKKIRDAILSSSL